MSMTNGSMFRSGVVPAASQPTGKGFVQIVKVGFIARPDGAVLTLTKVNPRGNDEMFVQPTGVDGEAWLNNEIEGIKAHQAEITAKTGTPSTVELNWPLEVYRSTRAVQKKDGTVEYVCRALFISLLSFGPDVCKILKGEASTQFAACKAVDEKKKAESWRYFHVVGGDAAMTPTQFAAKLAEFGM